MGKKVNEINTDYKAKSLAIDTLLKQAQHTAQLKDFGDAGFLIALKKLLECAIKEVDFHEAGLEEFRQEVLRDLVNRLRFQGDLKKHPEILDEDVSDPIIIIGLPRSGTTKMQRMMGADPTLFNTTMWQILNPAPFPNSNSQGKDPRIASACQGDSLLAEDNAEVHAAHFMTAESLEEFWNISEFTFNDWYQNCRTPLPAFSEWLKTRTEPSDFDKYGYMSSLLKYLQWQQGGKQGKRWLLKGCGHLAFIEELLAAFPNATVVHIHRHPLSSIPSWSKLEKDVWGLRVNAVQPKFIGHHLLDYAKFSLDRYMDTRTRLQLDERIFDVQYEQIRENPLPVIREIYRRAALALTDEGEQAMLQWHTDNEQHKHGRHVYSLEEFGLSEAIIKQTFSAYIERFLKTRSE